MERARRGGYARGVPVVVLVVLVAAPAALAYTYTDPTQVNLLEKWYPDGTYGVALTQSAGDATRAVTFQAGGGGWRVNNPELQPNQSVRARWDFAQPVNLGELRVKWRDANHTPTNYTFRDQSGTLVSATTSPFTQLRSHSVFTTSQWLEFECQPADTAVKIFEVDQIGAFLAPGTTLAMDGTYNVFYEEVGKPGFSQTGFSGASAWIDLWGGAWGNPTDDPGSVTWRFSQPYAFTGAYLSRGFPGLRVLEDSVIEVSSDGSSWTTVSAALDWNEGYRVFTSQATGNYVRLSWGDNTIGLSEIAEFQLFAIQPADRIPEPATLSLLALGALALIARRRS